MPHSTYLGFAYRNEVLYFWLMSLAEIKDHIAELSVEDRLEVTAWITHLNRRDDPQYQTELDRRRSAMKAGRKSTQHDLERLHHKLLAKGQ